MSSKPSSWRSSEPDSTMFTALHGELLLHLWRDPRVAQSDPYSLFVARSSAMGCLTEAVENASGGFWGMNDAGQGPDPISSSSQAAWFQVSLTEPVGNGRPLPVQAFLSCAGDVVARLGSLDLLAVQVLLPVHCVPGSLDQSSSVSAIGTLIQDAGWFTDCDPLRRAHIRVTLDSGQDPAIRSAAPEMLKWMQRINQDIFSCASYSSTDNEPEILKPGVIDALWRGPAHHRATFRGTLVEWSVDALGWLAAFLADACSRHGVNTPIMLTATRSEEPDPTHQPT